MGADPVEGVAGCEKSAGGDRETESCGDLAGGGMETGRDQGDGGRGCGVCDVEGVDATGKGPDWAVAGIANGRMVDRAAFDAILLIGHMNGGGPGGEKVSEGRVVANGIEVSIPKANIRAPEGDGAFATPVPGVFPGAEEVEERDEEQVGECRMCRRRSGALKVSRQLDGTEGECKLLFGSGVLMFPVLKEPFQRELEPAVVDARVGDVAVQGPFLANVADRFFCRRRIELTKSAVPALPDGNSKGQEDVKTLVC
jgi:hypothetical protein